MHLEKNEEVSNPVFLCADMCLQQPPVSDTVCKVDGGFLQHSHAGSQRLHFQNLNFHSYSLSHTHARIQRHMRKCTQPESVFSQLFSSSATL